MQNIQSDPADDVFNGWYVVATPFFIVLAGTGGRQGLGLFFERWTAEFGVSVSVVSVIAAVAIAGVKLDAFGSYLPVFATAVILLVLAATTTWALRERTYSSRFHPISLVRPRRPDRP